MDFSQGQFNVITTSLEHCSWLQQSRCQPLSKAEWFFCCIHRNRLPVLFTRPYNPQNRTFRGDLNPIYMVLWAHPSQPPLSVITQLTHVTNTQTHRPCYVWHL